MAQDQNDLLQRLMAILAASQGADLPEAGQRKPGDLAMALRDVMRVGGPTQTDPFSQSTAPPGGGGAIFLPPERNKPAEILSGLGDLFRGLRKAIPAIGAGVMEARAGSRSGASRGSAQEAADFLSRRRW